VAVRGILLDKDGTILDYWRTWVPVNREAALYAARGDALLAAELLRLGGHDPETDRITPGAPLAAGDFTDIARAFATHSDVAATAELVAGIARIFVRGGARHSALIEGAEAALLELQRRGFRLGIATNDSHAGTEASLAPHDNLPAFDFLAGADSGYGAKPGPGMALAFCAATGLAPPAVAVVGDAVHDLAMGRAAGVGLTVGVLSGTSRRADLVALADVIVESIAELPALPAFHAGVRPA
jgi:phosphoglycolate phosphatase